ncbi:MAG: family 43 glycosylhydrolase [Coprobacter sp.]|nr:family 43 glycosylhydrolase [Coprobacter sp.]
MKSSTLQTALVAITIGMLSSCSPKKIELGPNPFITHMYTADPSAHVWDDGRLYVYASHDIDPPRGCDLMDRYHVFSTDNMKDWTDHGEILNSHQVTWSTQPGFMWAPDCAYKDGTYYFYFPHPENENWGWSWQIGVAVSKSPATGFTVLDKPVQGEGISGHCMIDPCVFVDDDGKAYLFNGGCGRCVMAPLKDNMVELAAPATEVQGLENFHEGAWVHKYKGKYYLSYPDNTDGANNMCYAMSESIYGPWKSMGIFLASGEKGSGTIHGSIVEYKGEWFVFYHNKALSGRDELRSICVEKLEYNPDGTIKPVKQH